VLLLDFPAAGADAVRSFDDLRRLKPGCRGLVIAPHAWFPDSTCLRGQLDRQADLFDAVEWSYFWTRRLNFNARAARWARAHGKPIVGNSDLHDLRQFGRTYSLVDAPRDAGAICAAIREGRVTLATMPVPYLELTRVVGRLLTRGKKLNGPADPSKSPCTTSATPFERSASSPNSPSLRS
jgi:hypothetical protein